MADNNTAVGVYETHSLAEAAIRELEKSAFDLKSLSIIGKNYHSEEHVVGYYNTGDRMKAWGRQGAFWGGLWGLLFGGAFFFIPGIGLVAFAGPIVSALVGALETAAVVGGLSALGAGLASLGIPKNSVLSYESAIKADKFLVLVHGTAEEAARARSILGATGAIETSVH